MQRLNWPIIVAVCKLVLIQGLKHSNESRIGRRSSILWLSELIDGAYCWVLGKMTRGELCLSKDGKEEGFRVRGYVIGINPRQSSFLFG